MCGIIGYTGRRPAGPIVIDGLKRLEYRGYDSAGIALIDDQPRALHRRAAGKLDNLDARVEGSLPPAVAGIGHTRWATHGEPTDANAHPHLDPAGRVAVVHNGIVENFEAAACALPGTRRRCSPRETDSEVIAHMLADRLERRRRPGGGAAAGDAGAARARTPSSRSRAMSRGGWWRRASATPAGS